jgi:hypothetical protein
VLSAALPPETTVVGGTFNMVTQSNTTAACGSCYMNEQGLQIKTACGISPSAVLFWTCLAAAPGTCTGTGLDMDALVTCFYAYVRFDNTVYSRDQLLLLQ